MPDVDETLNLIWGAEAIAKVIGRSTRSTFHMLEKGELRYPQVWGHLDELGQDVSIFAHIYRRLHRGFRRRYPQL
ncbi:hypothetical protein CDO26_09125 [Sinorhizobium meliloti]|nr:hypothetical protein CDO26_09125 [Sinorhizobium meliloti]